MFNYTHPFVICSGFYRQSRLHTDTHRCITKYLHPPWICVCVWNKRLKDIYGNAIIYIKLYHFEANAKKIAWIKIANLLKEVNARARVASITTITHRTTTKEAF